MVNLDSWLIIPFAIAVFAFFKTIYNAGTKSKNDLVRLEQDYKNNPDKIFDLKDYPSLTYKDLVEHFGKDEVNLIKG